MAIENIPSMPVNSLSLLSDEHKQQFERNGFFVVENVLNATQLAHLRAKVSNLATAEYAAGLSHHYTASGKLQRVWNLLNKGAIFSEVIQHPLVVETMDWLFDRDTIHQKYYLSSFQANILNPGAEAQKWHLDTPVPEPHPLWILKANTIWLLDDFTEDNGATEVIPGSHLFPLRPREGDPLLNTNAMKVIASAGSMLVTHGMLWHRSGLNNSATSRTVLLGSFAASYLREMANEENLSVVLDQQVIAGASDQLRRMLGLDHGIKPGALFPARLES